MRTELDIEVLQEAKANAVKRYNAAASDTSKGFWEQVINDIDDEIIDIQQEQESLYNKTRIAVMILIVLVLLTIWLVGCATVQGVGHDINWMGTAGQEMLEHGHEYMKEK
jgi:predicted small secreted protein